MTWTDLYLVCFFLGFTTQLAFALRWHPSGHTPLRFPHRRDTPYSSLGRRRHGGEASRINFGTVSAFLAWFGGTGLIARAFSSFWFLFALGLAGMSGLVGATIMFYFLAKVLIQKDENLNPADYDMIGVLGKVSGKFDLGHWRNNVFPSRHEARAPARSEAQHRSRKALKSSSPVTSAASPTSALGRANQFRRSESKHVKEG